MTKERQDQLRLHRQFTGLEKDHALMECLNEIERLTADRDHWHKEYKTLEMASDALVRQRDMLVADKQRLANEVCRLNERIAHLSP